MGLLFTEENNAKNVFNQFNEELQYMIENDMLEQGLARLVLLGEDYTLEEEFEVAKELRSIDEDKANRISEQAIAEAVNVPMPELNSVASLEQATAKIKALTNQLNQKIKEQQDAVASKKGWFATVILNLKRAITWLKDKISSGYFKAKQAATGVFSKNKELDKATNEWKHANNQYNNVIQRTTFD